VSIKLRKINEEIYLRFVGFTLVLTGILMFVYCRLFGFNMLEVTVLSSPVFYLVLGLVCICVSLVEHVKPSVEVSV
jgi:hypothetical protein